MWMDVDGMGCGSKGNEHAKGPESAMHWQMGASRKLTAPGSSCTCLGFSAFRPGAGTWPRAGMLANRGRGPKKEGGEGGQGWWLSIGTAFHARVPPSCFPAASEEGVAEAGANTSPRLPRGGSSDRVPWPIRASAQMQGTYLADQPQQSRRIASSSSSIIPDRDERDDPEVETRFACLPETLFPTLFSSPARATQQRRSGSVYTGLFVVQPGVYRLPA